MRFLAAITVQERPPSPPILGGTGVQSHPEWRDLGGRSPKGRSERTHRTGVKV